MWFWQQAATRPDFWPDFAALTRRMADDEAGLRRKLWRKLKREVATIPFLEDVLTGCGLWEEGRKHSPALTGEPRPLASFPGASV